MCQLSATILTTFALPVFFELWGWRQKGAMGCMSRSELLTGSVDLPASGKVATVSQVTPPPPLPAVPPHPPTHILAMSASIHKIQILAARATCLLQTSLITFQHSNQPVLAITCLTPCLTQWNPPPMDNKHWLTALSVLGQDKAARCLTHRNPPPMDNKHWLTALSVLGQDKAARCLTHQNPPPMDNKHWLTALSVLGQDKAARCLTHRSLWEIHGLKDEAHDVGHLDDLAAHQTQLLVVVQHSVHVLDPQRVDGAVKDDPLAVWGVGWSELSECVSNNSICPLKKASITDMFNASYIKATTLLQTCFVQHIEEI